MYGIEINNLDPDCDIVVDTGAGPHYDGTIVS